MSKHLHTNQATFLALQPAIEANNEAYLLEKAGDYSGAEKGFTKALTIKRKLFSENSVEV